MRIISFGDIHEDTKNLVNLKDELRGADIVIISGDLTNYHGKVEAEKVIKSIREYNKNVFAQPGNLDQDEVNKYLSSEGINLHGNGFICGDIGIFGVGGSNSTPFNTPMELSEEAISGYLNAGYEKIKDAKIKIMVPHAPPFDTKMDLVSSGFHAGSKSVRDFIEQYKPDLCISGHIHEARGKDKLGDTILVNAGMFKEGGYIEAVYSDGKITAEVKVVKSI